MPLVRYKPANRSISARPRRPTTAPDSPLINRVHHKSSAPNRCVPRTLTIEVLRRVAAGNSNKIIADQLNLTEATVKAHMKNILSKLGANDRTHAVTIALKRGFLS